MFAFRGGVRILPYINKPHCSRTIHLVIAAMVVLHNELIDYVFGMMPIYQNLNEYIPQIGYFTFWLSILSIAVGYWFTLRKGRTEFSFSATHENVPSIIKTSKFMITAHIPYLNRETIAKASINLK